MTGEEMERAIEIILHNQANFELQFEKTNQQLQQTNRQMEATNQQMEATNRQMEATNARVEALAKQVETVAEQVGTVAETQTEFIQITIRHIEAQREINASVRGMLRELKESQTRTDERLGRLAETVERHISEGRNGNS